MDYQIDPMPQEQPAPNNKARRTLLILIAVLLIIIIGGGIWVAMMMRDQQKMIESERNAREQAELDRDQTVMHRDFEDLNREFEALEGQTFVIRNDSLRRDINEKYRLAKERMEKLQSQVDNLKSEHIKDQAEIKRLQNEIGSLREILRNYVQQVAELNEENKALRNENAVIKEENSRLNNRVQETSRQNERLNERMTLAEKLNVTGVSLTALNKKGKNEKNVKKAQQLMVTFTIPQNNSTPVGEKTIFLRIISPSGQLLGGAGSFSFEGASVQCTAKKSIEYAGEEVAGIHIYWDVNTALTPGEYTVELFTDNYRLIRRGYQLK
ncbi:MAG: hypothetical protein K2K05_05295 [Muribaculaceae bacterium]|nr:hypothetical protein [Muribaculaceae bacterium]